jgi:hypothetical protein
VETALFSLRRLFLLAGLVGNAAAGLAGRLAGGLALAAAAVFHAGAKVARLKGLDPLHNNTPIISAFSTVLHLYRLKHPAANVKTKYCTAKKNDPGAE